MNPLFFDLTVDKNSNTVSITREFAADKSLVWDAFTKKEILDQWWAPKPYRSETKTMDFKEGGFRLYAMVSPKDERHWAREDYEKINASESFTASKTFCDANGVVASGIPSSLWKHHFSEKASVTTVNIDIRYENAAHLEKMIEMGFKEGITVCLNQLEALL